MSRYDHATITLLLSESPGIRLSPKGDGRIEIPRSIVRVMGWKEGSTVLLHHDPRPEVIGLVIADVPSVPRERRLGPWLAGGSTVSMGRVRLPLSALKKAEMDGMDLVVVPEEDRVIVRPDLRAFREQIQAVYQLMRRHLPRNISFGAIADILAGRKSMLDKEQAVERLTLGLSEKEKSQERPREKVPGAFPSVDVKALEQGLKDHIVSLDEPEPDDEDPPTLAMPAPGRPLVARIVGNPYQFKTHWMVRDVFTHKGQLALCGPLCTVCEQRKADVLWLAPALVREAGSMRPGFVLAQGTLIRKIAQALKDKHRDRTDVIIYHRPWNEGMCAVHTNPPEDLPKEKLWRARLACAHPDVFLAAAFQEANEVDGAPRRPPMLMSANHMEFVPELKAAAVAAKAAAGAYTEEAMLDKLIDEIESGTRGGLA